MKDKFEELVLSAGGVKGVYFIGALEKLNQYYPLINFTYFTGCSAGGLLSTFLVIGYSIQEIKDIYFKINFLDFFDVKLTHLFDYGGFSKNDKLRNLFKSVFITKNIDINITFHELYSKTNKYLTLNSLNVSSGKICYLNHIETPNMCVLDALLMTMNIPIVFGLIPYDGNYYVDGAVLDPYPYNYHKNTIKFGMIIIDNNLFNIIHNIDLKNIQPNIFENFCRIFILIYNNYIKNVYKKKFKNTLIFKDISNTNLIEITQNDKNKLFLEGMTKMNIFLKKKYKKNHKNFLLKKYFFLLTQLIDCSSCY